MSSSSQVSSTISRKAEAMINKVDAVLDTAFAPKGSAMEQRTRRECNFSEVESQLPDLRPTPSSVNHPDLTTEILSHLGTFNPVRHEITENDTVWLLDNTAHRNKVGEWEAEFVAAVFDQNTGAEIAKVVAGVADRVGIARGAKAEDEIKKRLMPFVQNVLPGRVVRAEFAGQRELKLGPGGRNGISSDNEHVPKFRDGEVVGTVAQVPRGANGILKMKTVFAEPHGWGVISDIDDTIKITMTSDPIGILKSTFVNEATPIKGMPELYRYLQNSIGFESPFFYLSASPYNLYSFLNDFRQKYYPQGTMILRDASWMSLSGLLSNLTLGTQEYKVDRMVKINSWLPERKMICIGDSTQSDPEAYGEIYKKYPGFVRLILIRKVTDIAALGISEKNEPARFEKAFAGVPRNAWYVFEKPEECYRWILDIVARER